MNNEELESLSVAQGEAQARRMLEASIEQFSRKNYVEYAGVLIAEGDSWFKYPGDDILNVLEDDHAYDVRHVASSGDRIEDMAYNDGQLKDLLREIKKALDQGKTIDAILVSGGGNDIAGKSTFETFLNPAGAPNHGLNDQVVTAIIDTKIRAAYIHVLSAITQLCVDLTGSPIPIITHSYDYVVPDGRGKYWYGPWLQPGFTAKGYSDLAENTALVGTLIDRFNAMMSSLNGVPNLAHVHHIDVRGSLPNTPEVYKDWWDNELHPEKQGFKRVGDHFAAVIAAL